MFAISKTENISHFVLNRELGNRVSLNNFRDKCLIQNMREDNYMKSIFNSHRERVIGLHFRDYFAVTLFRDRIKLWNVETGKHLWTFSLTPQIYGRGKIEIVEDRIICTELTNFFRKRFAIIRIIDLATGIETAHISISKVELICVLGRRIFCSCKDDIIKELDFEGNVVREFQFEIQQYNRPGKFLGTGNFLVLIAAKSVMIYDLQKNCCKKTEIEVEGSSKFCGVNTAQIDGDRLISVILWNGRTIFNVIDLETGKVIDQYEVENEFLLGKMNREISVAITHKEWTYLGSSTGKIVAVNVAQRMHIVLGEHKSSVNYLAAEGQIVITGSHSVMEYPAELKFWDIKSMTKLKEMEFPSLFKISFISGNVFALIEGALVRWNYLVSHKGEVMSENSAQRIEKFGGFFY